MEAVGVEPTCIPHLYLKEWQYILNQNNAPIVPPQLKMICSSPAKHIRQHLFHQQTVDSPHERATPNLLRPSLELNTVEDSFLQLSRS